MFSGLLLQLLCFVSHFVCYPSLIVTGKKGGNVTLPCEFEARQISVIVLRRGSKKMLVCGIKGCESENSRIFKEGACDIVIKDLRLSDAGKYVLNVYHNDDQLESQMKYLHIQDEISVKTGDQLKLPVLLVSADKVETNSSGEWKEVWKRGHGVQSDRLTDADENLIINEFMDSDAGTYRVLDSEGEVLITVTVTALSGSVGENKASTHFAQEHWSWVDKFLFGCVTSIFLAYLVITVVQFVIMVAGMI